MNQHTAQLATCRDSGQPTVRPPGTRREPIAMSAGLPPGGSRATSKRGMSAGSWLKSASMFTLTSNPRFRAT